MILNIYNIILSYLLKISFLICYYCAENIFLIYCLLKNYVYLKITLFMAIWVIFVIGCVGVKA